MKYSERTYLAALAALAALRSSMSDAKEQATVDFVAAAIAEKADRDTNEPLTLEVLRKMNGQPVFVVYDEEVKEDTPGFDPLTLWALVEVTEESIFLTNNLGGRTEYAQGSDFEIDGITIYRQQPAPPEREAAHD